MRWRGLLTGILCHGVLGLSAGQAFAQSTVLSRAGAWEAYGAMAQNGTPVCGIYGRSEQNTHLHVKWFRGQNRLTIQAFKRSWSIPANTRMPVIMQIDGGAGWEATAIGERDMVEWTVTMTTFEDFATQFRAGLRMTVSFPSGSEPNWTISLIGSSATFRTMLGCIAYFNNPPTQPHNR